MFVFVLVLGLIANLATACIDCTVGEGDRGKLSLLSPILDDDYLKLIALANRAGLFGGATAAQQNALLYQKLMGQQQQHFHQQQPHTSSSSSFPSSFSPPPPPPPSSLTSALALASSPQLPSNLLHVYTLLNKGTPPSAAVAVTEPKLFVDDYLLQEPVIPKITKKAEKGMLVDVMDYVSKSEDRNRRVGQNMRSSG